MVDGSDGGVVAGGSRLCHRMDNAQCNNRFRQSEQDHDPVLGGSEQVGIEKQAVAEEWTIWPASEG